MYPEPEFPLTASSKGWTWFQLNIGNPLRNWNKDSDIWAFLIPTMLALPFFWTLSNYFFSEGNRFVMYGERSLVGSFTCIGPLEGQPELSQKDIIPSCPVSNPTFIVICIHKCLHRSFGPREDRVGRTAPLHSEQEESPLCLIRMSSFTRLGMPQFDREVDSTIGEPLACWKKLSLLLWSKTLRELADGIKWARQHVKISKNSECWGEDLQTKWSG
jgi:hypothetical protein